MHRKIYKNDDGSIKQENTLYLNDLVLSTNYEDIESIYVNSGGTYFICPKGKFHVHYYNKNSNANGNIKPENFKENNNWDLKCYLQFQEDILFIGYTNSPNDFYSFHLYDEVFLHHMNINNGLYAYSWRTETMANTDGVKQMFGIVKDGNYFFLKDLRITVKKGEDFGYTEGNSKIQLCELKSYHLTSFKRDFLGFYYINYNDQYDFESGYYNGESGELTLDNFKTIKIKNNKKSPFEFIDKITIKEMNFIFETRYAYYKIYNEDEQKDYYGVIDVTVNSIVFNTDKDIKEFKPFTNNSMLVRTDDSAYKICSIQENIYYNHLQCKDECNDKDQKLNLNPKQGNNCNVRCHWINWFELMPDDICIEECNEDYYIKKYNESNYETECWLCKDYDINKKYKLINKKDCLKDEPQNSESVYKKLFIFKCKDGYDFFENGNCVNKCSEHYFENNKICEECDNSCKACDKIAKNCTECKAYYYLDKSTSIYVCKECSEKCETCSEGEKDGFDNCLTCKKNSKYEFLFNKNCVENCPGGTYPNEEKVCIPKEEEEEKEEEKKGEEEKEKEGEEEKEKEGEEEKEKEAEKEKEKEAEKEKEKEIVDKSGEVKSKDKVMLSIYIVITASLLLLVMFCFCKKYCYKFRKRNLVEEIQSELVEKKEMF